MEQKGYLNYTPSNHFGYSLFCAGKIPQRSALINRGYYVRVRCMTENALKFIEKFAQVPMQIISLGCGFDTTYFRLATDPSLQQCIGNITWFDVDFGNLLEKKAPVLGKKYSLDQYPNYIPISCDIRDTVQLMKEFTAKGVNFEIPTLIIAECVLTYLPVDCCDRLLDNIAGSFRFGRIVVYEQIKNNENESVLDAFTETMMAHFESLATPIYSLLDYPTLSCQVERYKKAGFLNLVDAYSLYTYWMTCVSSDEKKRIKSLELFDEWEDWHIKLSHYFVLISDNYSIFNLTKVMPTVGVSFYKEQEMQVKKTEIDSSLVSNSLACTVQKISGFIQRYGHKGVAVDGKLYLLGGFGLQRDSHARIDGLETVCFDSFSNVVLLDAPTNRLYHSLVQYQSSKLVLFGGRKAPNLPLNDMWLYDITQNQWKELKGETIERIPPRYRHCSWIFRDKFYVFGGLDKNGELLNDLWVFDLIFNEWKQISVSYQTQKIFRHSAAACIVTIQNQPFACVTGGIGEDEVAFGDILLIPLINGSFIPKNHSIIPLVIEVPNLSPRYSHCCLVMNNSFVMLIGGVVDGNLSSQRFVQFVNLDNFSQEAENIEISKDCNLPSLVNSTIFITDKNEIFSIGGGFNAFSMGSYFDQCLQLRIIPKNKEGFETLLFSNQLRVTENCENTTPSSHFSFKLSNALDCSWEVPVIQGPIDKSIWDSWYSKRIPFLVRGHPFVKHSWTKEFLLSALPDDTLVSVHSGSNPLFSFVERNFEFKVIPFSQLVQSLEPQSISTTPGDFLYLRSIGDNPRKQQADVFKSFPALADSIDFPFSIIPDMKEHHFSSILRVTSPQVQLWTHYDIMDNILFQIRGSKIITLWLPSDYPFLKMQESSSCITDLNAECSDINNPFFNSHPTRFLLQEGDFLFIPSLVPHHTICSNDSPSYAINTFWKNLPDSLYQRKDLYGNKDLLSFNEASQLKDKSLQLLDQLPPYWKEFYQMRLLEINRMK